VLATHFWTDVLTDVAAPVAALDTVENALLRKPPTVDVPSSADASAWLLVPAAPGAPPW
jgi:hypothetical protein